MEIDSMAKRFVNVVIISLLCISQHERLASGSSSSMPEYLPKIDTHAHFIPTFYKDLLQAHNLTTAIRDWNVSAHLAMMAEYNIVTTVLSSTVPGAKLVRDEPVEVGRNLARELNLYAQNLTVVYPKQFLFFATLTLPDLEGAVAGAVYAIDTLGAAGVILQANNFGELLGTRRYDPLYKVLNDRKAVVLIHTSLSPCQSHIIFILSNVGGFLPFAATRVANTLATLAPISANESYEKLSEFSADLANSGTRTALPSIVTFYDESKLFYGTDYPYLLISVVDSALSVQMPPIPLSKKVIEKIAFGNAYN